MEGAREEEGRRKNQKGEGGERRGGGGSGGRKIGREGERKGGRLPSPSILPSPVHLVVVIVAAAGK
jgi:hypothetical protein